MLEITFALVPGRETENGSWQKQQRAAEKGKREICGHEEDAGLGATGFLHKQTNRLTNKICYTPSPHRFISLHWIRVFPCLLGEGAGADTKKQKPKLPAGSDLRCSQRCW